ncbi:BTAD domain-containing putative transcriptional regulator [Nonomuraea sp. NPDC050556]|uniref:AfsR/SARP family transcriptional regulator n=1 Tax=Nonomuraea sp. NPDC050556 TaxID=3364369 RepID=UPI0037A0BA6B
MALLGVVRAWRDGVEVDAGSPKMRLLLAVLALAEGRAVSKDRLIDLLWDDEPPRTALNSLRTYVSRLRSVLGDRAIMSAGDGYALGSFDSDLAEFEALVADGRPGQALKLWAGEALSGLEGAFAAGQRARLEELRLAALELRAEQDLDAGRHQEVVAELSALHAAHPLREQLSRLLMLALYRADRQAEAIAVYTGTRQLLDDELGVSPGQGLASLYQRIITGDPGLLLSAAPRVAQLPADIADFTGRAELIDSLVRRLVPGEALAIVAITGPGGVGKTSLAVRVGHRVRDRFPDGQLYADLDADDDVLGSFLRALGVARVPDSATERAALYRSELADRRMLVVLDNAADTAQIRPLLPGSPGCAVITTSRARPLGLAGAHVVDLDELSPDEALALFVAVSGRTGSAAAAEVVAACGHLPLAVRIAASRLAARPAWSVEVLRDRLADQRHRLAELRVGDLDVSATFALSYDQLGYVQARAFRLLAAADAPDLSVRQAALALDVTEREAEFLCETLADLSLLTVTGPGRYGYHDLVRAFALGKLQEEERSEAMLRLQTDWLESLRAHVDSADYVANEAACLVAMVEGAAPWPGETLVVARAVALLGGGADLAGMTEGLLVLGRQAQVIAEGRQPSVEGVQLTALRNALAGLGQVHD